MNIKRAKEEIKNAIAAYFLKDEYGEYVIPPMGQRPIFLLGAPGIGKTQIMEQVARECQVGLVAYTITHHTRQSAIGLPFVSKEVFEGREYTVTEYTMSEIVASIYKSIRETGLKEGILFIDEINCVSETLAPAMLQFLQCKSFGNHRIPKGWLIAAAGNPPEYNKSVREFDVVTMDRVKKIQVEPDFQAWKSYAYQANIHPAVLSYLNTKPQYFYQMESTVDGKFFATPRGWEDLSRLIAVYEQLDKKVDRDVVQQYIQYPKISKDFANYLELYYKYETDYQLDQVFKGNIDPVLVKKIGHASFDEKLSVIGLILARCRKAFLRYTKEEKKTTHLHNTLLTVKEALTGSRAGQPIPYLEELLVHLEEDQETMERAGLLSALEKECRLFVRDFMEKGILKGKAEGAETGEQVFRILSDSFGQVRSQYEMALHQGEETLEMAFDFMEAVFGAGQEMVTFVTELNTDYYSIHFLQQYECKRYFQYNKELLLEESNRQLLQKIDTLL